MTLFQRLAAALCAALCITAAPAYATSYSVDFTDLWFIPAESGWGFNVIQQGNTLFGTLFVYTNDRSARWYVASDMKPQTASAGQAKFGGKLYQTTGPFLGDATFNPGEVGVTEVGDISITFITATSATLAYNVGGTTVTKNVTRQTFVKDTPAGTFQGGMSAVTFACANSSSNGQFAQFLGFITATLSATDVAIFRMEYLLNGSSAICNFSGNFSQQGRLGTITGGNWACSQGTNALNTGTFTITNLDIQVSGMSGTITAADQFCSYDGRFGGIRSATN